MTRNIATILVLLLAATVQISVFPIIFPLFPGPNLFLLLVVYRAVTNGFVGTWRYAVLAGAILDLLLWSPLGTHVLIFALVSAAAGSLAKRFLVVHQPWNLLALVGIVALASLASDLGLWLITRLLAAESLRQAVFFKFTPSSALLGAVSTALAMLLFYWPARAVSRRWRWFLRSGNPVPKLH
jgi:rod shape-determining protein MreD